MPVVGPVAVVAGVDLSEAGSLFWIFGGWFCLNLSTNARGTGTGGVCTIFLIEFIEYHLGLEQNLGLGFSYSRF